MVLRCCDLPELGFNASYNFRNLSRQEPSYGAEKKSTDNTQANSSSTVKLNQLYRIALYGPMMLRELGFEAS